MIQVMQGRLSRALAKERELADTKAPLLPEVRENFAMLFRIYHDHFPTLQESGLEPKAPQNVKVESSRWSRRRRTGTCSRDTMWDFSRL